MISKKFLFMLFFALLTIACFVPCLMADEKIQDTFTSPTTGAKFVLIPAGNFMMGSSVDEEKRFEALNSKYAAPNYESERPQHQVTISRPFYMQTTEVTQGHWKRVMGNNPSVFDRCGDDCPVENVSWDDVQGFIKKLNNMEGTDKYRLPTEAEWEYACRAGTTTRFYTGDSEEDLSRAGWYRFNSGDKTHPVGQKTPNSWGLYDMHGNVYEWVQDRGGTYPSGSVTDPRGPISGDNRIARGAAWNRIVNNSRSASRLWGVTDKRNRKNNVGFRLAYSIIGNDQQAIKDYDKLIELDPKNAVVYFSRGTAYGRLGNDQQAIKDFDKSIELDPKNAVVYSDRGYTYFRLGNDQQAIKDYDKAIELDPKFSLAYSNRGPAYTRLGNHQYAIKDYDKVVELNPNSTVAYSNRGLAYINLGNHQQAVKDFDKAIELNPKNITAYHGRGIAYSRLGKDQQAIKDYDKLIELDPKNAAGYYDRGNVYEKLGNNQQAISDLKIAAQLGHKEAQNLLKKKGIAW